MDDNKTKYHNGARSKNSVLSILIELKEKGILRHCSSEYRCGYPGKNQKQFFAPFFIEFPSGYCWILFPSNSIRTDRMNIQQWNAENIKKINNNVVKAYLVVPDEIVDNEKEFKIAFQYDTRLRSGEFYTSIDGVIIQKQIEKMCIDYLSNEEAYE